MNMIGAVVSNGLDRLRNASCYSYSRRAGAIVRYLDHVDRRIRRYIRSRQKLISLLNEQKQAIIKP